MPTQKRLKELLNYDPQTGVFTRKVRTGQRVRVGDVAGGTDSYGYTQIRVDSRLCLAHRLAWIYVYGCLPAGGEIDHINRVRNDNRIANLRECSRAENNQNTSKRKGTSSKYPGVTRSGNRWSAQVGFNKKVHRLGRFDTEEEAHAAYASAKARLHLFNPTVNTDTPHQTHAA